MVAGVPLSNFHALKTKEEDGYRLSAEALEAAIKADLEKGNLPAFCCASLGTTSSGVFDDLKAIGAVCKKVSMSHQLGSAISTAGRCPTVRAMAACGCRLGWCFLCLPRTARPARRN